VNFGLLGHSPQELPSSAARSRDHGDETGAPLLELHTDAGVVYVCPSRWQRIRLQWAFRHFRQLPLQVLSRRDQRLVEKLMRSAQAPPSAGTTVLGVVENVHPKPAVAAARVVTMRPQLTPQKPFRAVPWTPTLLSPDFSQRSKEKEVKQLFGTAKSRDVRSVGFRQWGALAALSAVCAALIVASLYGVLPSSTTKPAPHAPAVPAQTLASNQVKPPAAITPAYVSTATLLPTLKLKHAWVLPVGASQPHNELASLENELNPRASVANSRNTPVPAAAIPSNAEPLLVSELPQGHFAHPVVSEPNLVGELQLKALIGADGLVKQVTVLSGNPKLAAAGMRAVRQWRYAPYEVLGNPVAVETHIKMSFFGEDAVSVASVSTGPPTGPRLASVPSVHDQPLSPRAND
jgi:hypothetical protein